ncbi:hypothetical protein PIB30_031075 [Stylosanthes scabra]|uniref:Uncharacterized protein n=1 Tax=Stylosanthes scabra TaxID=79078 RepID=A0ABU6SCE2_9FABA|nr:hypothetical protein [Stylosanthes scabra]
MSVEPIRFWTEPKSDFLNRFVVLASRLDALGLRKILGTYKLSESIRANDSAYGDGGPSGVVSACGMQVVTSSLAARLRPLKDRALTIVSMFCILVGSGRGYALSSIGSDLSWEVEAWGVKTSMTKARLGRKAITHRRGGDEADGTRKSWSVELCTLHRNEVIGFRVCSVVHGIKFSCEGVTYGVAVCENSLALVSGTFNIN